MSDNVSEHRGLRSGPCCCKRKCEEKEKKTLDEKLVKDRKQKGSYYSIFKELKEDDPQSFVDYMRMKPNLFENFLNKLQPLIQKQNKMRL